MYVFLKQEKTEKGFYTSFKNENGDVLNVKSTELFDIVDFLKKLNNYKDYGEVFANKFLTLTKDQADYIFENSIHHENAEEPLGNYTEFTPKFVKNVTFKNGKNCKLFTGLSVGKNLTHDGDLLYCELYFLKIYVDEKNEKNLQLFTTLKNHFKGVNCFQYFKNVFETTIFLTGNSLSAVQKQYKLWPTLQIIKGKNNDKQ